MTKTKRVEKTTYFGDKTKLPETGNGKTEKYDDPFPNENSVYPLATTKDIHISLCLVFT